MNGNCEKKKQYQNMKMLQKIEHYIMEFVKDIDKWKADINLIQIIVQTTKL